MSYSITDSIVIFKSESGYFSSRQRLKRPLLHFDESVARSFSSLNLNFFLMHTIDYLTFKLHLGEFIFSSITLTMTFTTASESDS